MPGGKNENLDWGAMLAQSLKGSLGLILPCQGVEAKHSGVGL